MRFTGLVVGLLALAGGAARAQDCHLQQYASIAFTKTPQGLMLPVKIGDVQKDMAFSLGAASNALPSATAHELDLRITTLPSNIHQHYGNANIYYVARAPHVTIDGNRFDNVDFLMLPPQANNDTQGDIGMRLMAHADIELDMAAGKLNLFSDGHCPGKVVYWTTTGFVKVPLEIDDHDFIRAELDLDGKPVNFALNSDGGSTISMNAMHKLFGVDESSPGMTLDHTNADGVKFYRYPFQKLGTEGLAINNPAILVRDTGRTGCIAGVHPFAGSGPGSGAIETNLLTETHCYGGADGGLGLSVLSKLHLYVSKKEKLLYLTGAGAH